MAAPHCADASLCAQRFSYKNARFSDYAQNQEPIAVTLGARKDFTGVDGRLLAQGAEAVSVLHHQLLGSLATIGCELVKDAHIGFAFEPHVSLLRRVPTQTA